MSDEERACIRSRLQDYGVNTSHLAQGFSSMNLCSNSPRFADQWCAISPGWATIPPGHLPEGISPALLDLLAVHPAWAGTAELPAPWHSMILVEHAAQSQFDLLVKALREGLSLPHGLLCLAGSGAGFHGQQGRRWLAVHGNLHLSMVLAPGLPLRAIAAGLALLPAVSLVQLLDSLPGLEHRAGIRWVNDIVVDGSKLAGFLVHTQSWSGAVTGVVIGIGLNVETIPPVPPTLFVPSVTSLRAQVGDPDACARPVVLRKLLHLLGRNVDLLLRGRTAELIAFYRERSLVVGRHVDVYADGLDGGGRPSVVGRVVAIGDGLELLLAGVSRPVVGGRVVIRE